jgi:hypothetical protein
LVVLTEKKFPFLEKVSFVCTSEPSRIILMLHSKTPFLKSKERQKKWKRKTASKDNKK